MVTHRRQKKVPMQLVTKLNLVSERSAQYGPYLVDAATLPRRKITMSYQPPQGTDDRPPQRRLRAPPHPQFVSEP